jgi:putative colanic acid biosynthesis UDP-glucose lipid carrier transferase
MNTTGPEIYAVAGSTNAPATTLALDASYGTVAAAPRHGPPCRFVTDARAILLVGLFFADLAVVLGAGIASNLIWYDTLQLPKGYWAHVAIGYALFLAMMHFAGMYQFAELSRNPRHLRRLSGVWVTVVLIVMVVVYFSTFMSASFHVSIILWALNGWLGLTATRILAWQVIRRFRSRSQLIVQAAVIGSGTIADRCAQWLRENGRGDVKVVGVFDVSEAAADAQDNRCGGRLDELVRLRAEVRIDEIVVALRRSELIEVVSGLVPATDIKVSFDLNTAAPRIGDAPFVVVPIRQRRLAGVPAVVKRNLDIFGSALLLAVALPLMVVIAVLVKLESPGSILFKQQRFGFNKQPFDIFKFRSMRCEACAAPIVTQARRDDPRVTRVGRFLRRTSLDELPQLLNVLRGEMSLVGPRPHAALHDEQFASLVDGYVARHSVKPGISGWAQVNGSRGETDTLEKMRRRIEYDLYYINNWSLSLDCRILWKTLAIVLGQQNAY